MEDRSAAAAAVVEGPHRVSYAGRRDAGAAFSRWRDEAGAMGRLYEVKEPSEAFHASATRLNLPHAALAEFGYCGMSYVREPRRVRADGCDMVWIQLTHEGGLRGRFGDRDVVAGAGSALFADYGQPGEHTSVESRGRFLLLPRSAFEGRDVAPLHGRVVAGAAYRRLEAYLRWLERTLPDASVASAERVQAAIGAVVQGTFEKAAEPALEDSGALDGLALHRLRDLIRSRIPDGAVEPAALASALGVSRASVYRLAAPYGGVMSMVWELRLEAVHAALNDPDELGGVGVIGQVYGFTSTQHFSRRFRDRFGFSPSDLRGRLGSS